jgi:hypothetical protein
MQNITSDFTQLHTHTHIKPKICQINHTSCKALNNPQKRCAVNSLTRHYQERVKPHKYFLEFKASIAPCIIRIIKSRRMRWVGNTPCMEQKSNANHKVLVRKPEDIIEKTYM